MYLQWKSIARSCKCTAFRKIMYFTWIRARNESYKRTPWKLTAVWKTVVFQCVSMCFMTSTMKGAHLIILLNSVSVHASTPVSNCCQHLSYSEYLTILTWGENCTLWQYDNDLFWDLSLLSLVALFSSFFKIHFTTTATAWRYVARSRRSHASHPSQRQLHRTMTNLPLEQKQLLPTPKPTPSNSISPFPFGEGVAKLWKLGRHNRAWRHCYQQLSEMRFMRL